jgi:hypothetical protein
MSRVPTISKDFAYAECPTGLPDNFDFSACAIDGVQVDCASIVQEGPCGPFVVTILDIEEQLWTSEQIETLTEAQRLLAALLNARFVKVQYEH